MKLFLAIVIVMCQQCISARAQEINWIQQSSWKEIQDQAKSEGKYIFIDCYATWCAPCKEMDKKVYTNDTVGSFFNDHFISVKLQMDSTGADNEKIKKMYALVRQIRSEYQVQALPTLLFFSSNGLLLNSEIGYRNPSALVKIANDAISPERIAFYTELEKYKAGEKNYKTMKDLASFVLKAVRDRGLAKQIADDYLSHTNQQDLLNIPTIYFVRDVARNNKLSKELARSYLDRTSLDTLLTKSNLDFVNIFITVVRTNDTLFKLFKTDSARIDRIISYRGWAKSMLNDVITNVELRERLVLEGKPISAQHPDWVRMESEMKQKYPFVNVDKLVLDFQIEYYRWYKQDWKEWARYKDQRIAKYPPNPENAYIISSELNNGGAWDAFLHCNDKAVLKQSLSWIDLYIKISKKVNPKDFPIYLLDTKANVLYKIGRISEAIKIESEIVSYLKKKDENGKINDLFNEYNEVLKKMKEGKPTYLEEGAEWTDETLKNIKLK